MARRLSSRRRSGRLRRPACGGALDRGRRRVPCKHTVRQLARLVWERVDAHGARALLVVWTGARARLYKSTAWIPVIVLTAFSPCAQDMVSLGCVQAPDSPSEPPSPPALPPQAPSTLSLPPPATPGPPLAPPPAPPAAAISPAPPRQPVITDPGGGPLLSSFPTGPPLPSSPLPPGPPPTPPIELDTAPVLAELPP